MPECLELSRNFHIVRDIQPTSEASSNEDLKFITMEYVVDNMDYETCVNAVGGIISRQKGVAKSKITSFESGKLEMHVDATISSLGQRQSFEQELDRLLRLDDYELH